MDPKTSRRIFELARDQQDELGEKDLDDEDEDDDQHDLSIPRATLPADDDDLDDLDQYEDKDDEEIEEIVSKIFNLMTHLDDIRSQEVDEDDMKALDVMLPTNAGERRTLADIIFSKLDNLEAGKPDAALEKRHGTSSLHMSLTNDINGPADPSRIPDPAAGLDPKVVDVYTKYALRLF